MGGTAPANGSVPSGPYMSGLEETSKIYYIITEINRAADALEAAGRIGINERGSLKGGGGI